MRLCSTLNSALVGLLVVGCADNPTGLSTRPASASVDLATASRAPLTENFLYSFCTDELLPLTGTTQMVYSLTETATGVIHHQLHFRIHAVSTSPTTGEPLVINTIETRVWPDFESFSEGTGEGTLVFVTKGNAPNEVVRYEYHLTITPNGTVTGAFENFTLRCN